MKNKVSFAISEEHLLHLIITLCNAPKEYILETPTEKLTLYIARDRDSDIMDNNLIKAQLQEELRKRFSLPERKWRNQQIICDAAEV